MPINFYEDDDLELGIETKVRYVRTPDGAKRFGLPIGSPILPGMKPGDVARNMAILKGNAAGKPGRQGAPKKFDRHLFSASDDLDPKQYEHWRKMTPSERGLYLNKRESGQSHDTAISRTPSPKPAASSDGAVRTPRPKDLGGGVEGVDSSGVPFTSGTGVRTRAPLVGSAVGNDETVVESSPLRFVTKSTLRKGLRIYERDTPDGNWKWVNKRGSGGNAQETPPKNRDNSGDDAAAAGVRSSAAARAAELATWRRKYASMKKGKGFGDPAADKEYYDDLPPKEKARHDRWMDENNGNLAAAIDAIEPTQEPAEGPARRQERPVGPSMGTNELDDFIASETRRPRKGPDGMTETQRIKAGLAAEAELRRIQSGKSSGDAAAVARVTKPMKTFYNAQSRGDKVVLTRAIRAGRVTSVAEMRALLRGRKTR